MKLIQARIDGFRSVKEQLKLNVDPKVTILIGANDHGKTNLLEAILSLNDDRPFQAEDENWDLIGQGKLTVDYDFQLDSEEIEWLKSQVTKAEGGADAEAGVRADEAVQASTPPTSSSSDGAVATSASPKPEADEQVALAEQGIGKGPGEPGRGFELPQAITFRREGVAGALKVLLNGRLAKIEGISEYFLKARPRVELFASAEQLMDVVTLAQLEDPKQEFMQGIFRYAAIWESRKGLFKQDPATAKRLERASEDFTSRIRIEWKQGEDLTFRFLHAGQSGNQIELLIRDPSVSERFVRPSERSEGFSAFFKLNMRLLARTESNPAHKYVFLFDEPGTALHPSGQVNLQRVFERLSRDNKIIYAIHSLFMVNHNRPERNRVVSKDTGGTKIDQKPYLRNWRAVRDSLGLILAGNFFIADTTLLLEGESDAMYVGAMLAAFDRAEIIDIDLNLFSVQWAGNSRDFEPMARLMLEEGRRVAAMVDGDRAGSDLKRRIDRLNDSVNSGRIGARGPVDLMQLDRNNSIEDILPCPDQYLNAVVAAAEELIAGGYRELAESVTLNRESLLQNLKENRGNVTLGRHVENVTGTWFKVKEAISKLMIARHYCAWLEEANLGNEGVSACPPALVKLIEALKLESKLSEEAVFAQSKA